MRRTGNSLIFHGLQMAMKTDPNGDGGEENGDENQEGSRQGVGAACQLSYAK